MFVNKRFLCVVFSILIIFSAAVPCLAAEATNSSAYNLPTETAVSGWVSANTDQCTWSLNFNELDVNGEAVVNENSSVRLEPKSGITFSVYLPETANYSFYLKYYSEDSLFTDCLLNLELDGSQSVVSLPILWRDGSSEYSKDKNGNEVVPDQVIVDRPYYNALCDYASINKNTARFELQKGTHSVSLSPQSQSIIISGIYLLKDESLPTYKEYIAANNGNETTELAVIEAEHYSLKSDSYIMPKTVKNSALYPYDSKHNLLNVIDEATYGSAGQKVLWEFEVKEEGCYGIALRYIQNSAVNMPVYRKLEIDGRVPFKEANAIEFKSTPSGKYNNTVLQVDGEKLLVYLTAGKHTIALTATMGPLEEVYKTVSELMEDIDSLGMDLQRLTAGQTDTNRTWNLDYYLPNAVDDILSFADRAEEIYNQLEKIGGVTPSYASGLKYAAERLRKLTDTPNKIPAKTDLLNVGDNSASKYIGNVLSSLSNLSLGIDRIYVGDTSDLPSARASLFRSIVEGIQSFFLSFTSNYNSSSYSTSGRGDGKDSLAVWINASIPYVQVLQRIVDEDYNTNNDTNIQLSIMPSESKLVLANAAGTNPDVVLHADMQTPFKFAIRNAAKNFLEYNDFLTFYNENYNLQSLVPCTYGEGVYGVAETQDFNVLFYRKDILKALDLSVPDTWDDVKEMMPTLLRYGKNFNIPLASSAAYKGFSVTSPYVFQNNGTYVTDDGLSATFDSDSFLDAMTEMTELFTIYGVSTSVPSFYNSFRNGEIPIGISSYATYMQLQVAAPELAGKWAIAKAPGTLQEDGTVLRYQPAASSACIIFANTEKSEEAWDFLKWWLSTETQVKYAYKMQNTYGSEYRWNTANLNAFSQLSYPKDDMNTILEQLQSQKEVTGHPAAYMIERQTSEIWNGVVVDNQPLMDEIDNSLISTNREITRKLKEFGYVDSDGKPVKNYSMNAYEMLQSKLVKASEKKNEKGAAE